MTLSETLAIVSPVLTLLLALAGALYIRGRLDGHADSVTNELTKLGAKVDTFSELRDMALSSKIGLERHEAECIRRQNDTKDRFDRIDASLDNLRGQITNVATGRAGKLYEVKPDLLANP